MPLSLSFLAVLLHSVQTHCNKLTSLSWFFLAFIVWQLSQTLVILIRFDDQHIKRIIKGVETMQQLMLSSIHNRTIKDWQISRCKLAFLSSKIHIWIIGCLIHPIKCFNLSVLLFCQNMCIYYFPSILNGQLPHILADTCQFLEEKRDV